MEISTVRTRFLVGAFATFMIVGSGVATALVTSSDGPTLGEAVDATVSTSPGDTVGTTTPSTPGVTTGTSPSGSDPTESDGATDTARYWGPECGDGDGNHGQYVASQPKGGESRSSAAQSDCGKPLASIGDGSDDEDSDEAPESDAPDADDTTSGSPSQGNGNSNGNGSSNGNAYGRNKSS